MRLGWSHCCWVFVATAVVAARNNIAKVSPNHANSSKNHRVGALLNSAPMRRHLDLH